jgi:hypothetical protein
LQSALLALERHHAAELRKALSEVREHCCFLEEENEELSMLAFLNERQIAELKTGGPASAGPGGASGGADRDRADRGDRERARSRSRSRCALCSDFLLQFFGGFKRKLSQVTSEGCACLPLLLACPEL